MGRNKKQNSILSIAVSIMIPVIFVLVMLFVIALYNLNKAREMAYKYMLDTAALYVKDIAADIGKINFEVYKRGSDSTYFQDISGEIIPQNAKNYQRFNEIVTDNENLQSQYGTEYNFYVYDRNTDFLVCASGIYFEKGYETELSRQMRGQLKSFGKSEWKWSYFYVDGKPYLMSAYVMPEEVFGCCIDVQLLLKNLELTNMGYRMVPYIRLNDGELFTASSYANMEEIESDLESYRSWNRWLDYKTYRFSVSNIFEIEMLLLPEEGVLEELVGIQFVLLAVSMGVVLIIGFGGYYLYLKLLRPMRQFARKIQNLDEEVFLNNTDSFDVIELERVSAEYKELLRSMRLLKIEVYEKELISRQVELEYVQEQMQSHFYLNCLSILHGMAEDSRNDQMMHFLRLLSGYMRYVISDSYKMKKISEELAHINDYVQIQQIRYKNSFLYEADVEEALKDCYVPTLVLQTFVENAVKHGKTKDARLTISLFITSEQINGEEYLYIVISDTGGGFSEDILKSIEENNPIFYDDRKHVGIANVKQRLKLIYDSKAVLKLSNMAKNYGAVVEITLPILWKEDRKKV